MSLSRALGLDPPPISCFACFQISEPPAHWPLRASLMIWGQPVGGAGWRDEGRGGGLEAVRLSIVLPILVKSRLLLP